MELTKKQKTLKYICYCVMILLADLLQNTPGLFVEIFGARCFLLLPLTIMISIDEDPLSAAFLGLFAGLLWDVAGSVHLGFNCIYIAVICFLSAALVTYIARNTFITNIIVTAFWIILYCLLYWLFFIIIRGVPGAQSTIFTFYIPCAVYTVALTPVIWLVLKPLKSKLNHEKDHNFS